MPSIKLSIAEPCHENWNAMLPEEKGRYCLSCQKTVVDFTNMNDRQVFDYFKTYKGNTCGQFSKDQLDRELTKPKTHSIGRWKYFWQILLPAVFTLHRAEAQTKLKGKVAATSSCTPKTPDRPPVMIMGLIATPSQVVKPAAERIIVGKITNSKQEAVPFASVTSSNGKGVASDSAGNFKIALAGTETLTISAIGYLKRNFTIDSLQTNHISAIKLEKGQVVVEMNFVLEMEDSKVGEVVVVGYKSKTNYDMVGSVSMARSKTFFSNVKVTAPARKTPQLKIFPNPIQAGQNFKITFSVKRAGTYLMRIVDASGRSTIEENFLLTSTNQTETVNGNLLRQAGVYFIELINPVNKKEKPLSGRLLVK